MKLNNIIGHLTSKITFKNTNFIIKEIILETSLNIAKLN